MNNPIPSIDKRIIRCYRLRASKHPGWLSGTDIAGKAWNDALRAFLLGISVPVTQISERQEQRHRLQQLSKTRSSKSTQVICGAPVGLLVGAVSGLEGISRNVVYKLRDNNRSAMDDILIAGCSAITAMSVGCWIYGFRGRGNVVVSALAGLVNAGFEAYKSSASESSEYEYEYYGVIICER